MNPLVDPRQVFEDVLLNLRESPNLLSMVLLIGDPEVYVVSQRVDLMHVVVQVHEVFLCFLQLVAERVAVVSQLVNHLLLEHEFLLLGAYLHFGQFKS